MWKHSSKSPTVNNRNYGIRNHQQRNARNETTHLGHSGSKQTHSGDCPNAPSAVRGRNLPYGAGGLRTPFRQPSHLAGLSGQGYYPLHPNRRENPLSTIRHQPTIARELSEIKHLQEAFSCRLATTQKEPAEWLSKRYRAISPSLGIFLLITRYLFAINQVHLRYRYKVVSSASESSDFGRKNEGKIYQLWTELDQIKMGSIR